MSELSPADVASSAAEQLMDSSESAHLLGPYVRRLAVTSEDYVALSIATDQNRGTNELAAGLLETIDMPSFDQPTDCPNQNLSRTELKGTFHAIAQGLDSIPAAQADGTIDWQRLALGLLDQVLEAGSEPSGDMEESDNITDIQLTAALASALLAEDLTTRHGFLRKVYQYDLHYRLATITRHSTLSYISGDSPHDSVKWINSYRPAFRARAEDVEAYIEYTTAEADTASSERSAPKKRQRQVTAAYKDRGAEVDEELLSAAQLDSRAPDGQTSDFIDPYKVERFGLQHILIEEQLQIFFPNQDIQDSPLAAGLEYARYRAEIVVPEADHDPFDALYIDARAVLLALSRQVIAPYELDSIRPLTYRQAITERFKEINQLSRYMTMVSHFINHTGSHGVFAERELWTVAQQGADTPNQIRALLSNTIDQALRYQAETGVTVEADSLRQSLQQRRKYLTRLAMVNINDHTELGNRGEFRPVSLQELGKTIVASTTNPDDLPKSWSVSTGSEASDEVEIYIPLAHKKIAGLAKKYYGATLGCPAGRIGREDTKQAGQRGIHATNNLIDYVSEVMINEAYLRGLLDLERYS